MIKVSYKKVIVILKLLKKINLILTLIYHKTAISSIFMISSTQYLIKIENILNVP